jgi:hypothetical protein
MDKHRDRNAVVKLEMTVGSIIVCKAIGTPLYGHYSIRTLIIKDLRNFLFLAYPLQSAFYLLLSVHMRTGVYNCRYIPKDCFKTSGFTSPAL